MTWVLIFPFKGVHLNPSGLCNMRIWYGCWAWSLRKAREAPWRARSFWSPSSWGRAACLSTCGPGAGSMSPRRTRLDLPSTLLVAWPTWRAGEVASKAPVKNVQHSSLDPPRNLNQVTWCLPGPANCFYISDCDVPSGMLSIETWLPGMYYCPTMGKQRWSVGMVLMIKRPFSHSYAQVADFGLASTDGATIDSGKLPIKWTAPEVRNLIQDLQGGHFCCCRHWDILISQTNPTCGVLGCFSGRSTPLGGFPILESP